ncbi:hypothetical protein EAI_08669 [Harpegnathos saltator]|uniref:Uncharacterized protein n=1 Tax=Harpegnathos saltator TaxID=610380 RepID=E2B2T7_HARSA|nr:hypothetical protein EAI_08669 [Harpegnathos saltator]
MCSSSVMETPAIIRSSDSRNAFKITVDIMADRVLLALQFADKSRSSGSHGDPVLRDYATIDARVTTQLVPANIPQLLSEIPREQHHRHIAINRTQKYSVNESPLKRDDIRGVLLRN